MTEQTEQTEKHFPMTLTWLLGMVEDEPVYESITETDSETSKKIVSSLNRNSVSGNIACKELKGEIENMVQANIPVDAVFGVETDRRKLEITLENLYNLVSVDFDLEIKPKESDDKAVKGLTGLLGKFKDAIIRFDNLVVDLTEATTSNQNTILQREVGDLIKVELSPVGGGSPSQISTNEVIDSINYNITPDIFSCSYKLSNADVQAFMRLDNVLFGILDTDKLGY